MANGDNKTVPTDASVSAFLETIADEAKRRDSERLIAMMGEVTGEPAIMWGPAIIGFGSYHYVYGSGREGDTPEVSFSPRKANLTLYVRKDWQSQTEILERLGSFKAGKGCLYLKSLDKVNEDALRDLIAWSIQEEM
jgi:hypothetical protein